MQRLTASSGCPTIDAELSAFADVVLRADADELLVLRYAPYFRIWYACGCMSVNAAVRAGMHERGIPGADVYWRGMGYLEDATFAYDTFNEKPLSQSQRWNAFYDRVHQTKSLRLLRHPA